MIESRLFRTLAAPVAVAVLFLLVTPKLCQRAVMQGMAKRRNEPLTTTATSHAGLIIESSTPAPGSASANLHFPDGLDSGRIEYLIEIDQAFAAPSSMPVTETAPITYELVTRQYVEKRPDGTYVPTRDGLINVNGATESSDGWIVPVAQRKFVRVAKIDDVGDGRYDVSVLWRWEPTAVGASALPRPQDHLMIAEFAGGEGHWILDHWVREPDRELR